MLQGFGICGLRKQRTALVCEIALVALVNEPEALKGESIVYLLD
jgi:hypothetical protein